MSNKNKQHGQGENIALMSPEADEGVRAAGSGDSAKVERSAKGGGSSKVGGSAKVEDSAKSGRPAKGAHSADVVRPSRSGKGRKYLIVSLAVFAVVLVAACAAAFIVISRLAAPFTAEVGESVDISRLTEGFAGMICRVEGVGRSSDGEGETTATVPTDKIGEQSLDVIFFGFIRRSVPVFVRDTVPPQLEVRNLTVVNALGVTPEDFVVSSYDLTSLTFRFAEPLGELDSRVEKDVVIIATDEGGNETSKTAHFSCGDPTLSVQAEFGVSTEDDIRAELSELNPWVGEIDLSEVDLATPGEYTVSASTGDTLCLLCVTVSDTVAPSADVRSMDLRLGDSVKDEDIVSNVVDHSPVTVTVGEKELSKAGAHTVAVILEDEAGNRTELESQLCVHDVPREVEIELGTTEKELSGLLTNGDDTLSLPAGFSISSLSLGKNNVTLKGVYSDLTSTVTVRDTTPPVLKLKDVTVIGRRGVSPGDFVVSCTDASAVSLSFEGSVSATVAGTSAVTVVATDAAGNVTKAKASLTVIVDSLPPVIYGVHDISLEVGGKASFSNGVYAMDDVDGGVYVNVDSSAVNTSVAGSYTVYYSASDSSGNTARASATVTVSPMSLNTVYSMADSLLAQITTPGMTARQKAWAIYSWCSANIRYSTSTSYLMGNFVQGAYSGFRTRAGNCYIYYAVASCMLTRCGIENIEISRNDPANPHYWNMVKIDGAWYHFDSCPHYKNAPLTAFLLTDAQVAEYSATKSPGYYSFDKSKYPRTP